MEDPQVIVGQIAQKVGDTKGGWLFKVPPIRIHHAPSLRGDGAVLELHAGERTRAAVETRLRLVASPRLARGWTWVR